MLIRTSRRALLAGSLAALSTGRALAIGGGGAFGAASPPLTVGLTCDVGPRELAITCAALRSWSGSCAIVRFPSWGSLIDHLTAPAGSAVDAAVVPRAALARLEPCDKTLERFATVPLPRPEPGGTASLLFSPALSAPHPTQPRRPFVLARAISDPVCDAKLLSVMRSLHGEACGPLLIELAPAAMQGNVSAGRVDMALLTGPDAERWTAGHERAGLQVRRLEGTDARVLSPRMALVVRPQASRTACVPGQFRSPRMQA